MVHWCHIAFRVSNFLLEEYYIQLVIIIIAVIHCTGARAV